MVRELFNGKSSEPSSISGGNRSQNIKKDLKYNINVITIFLALYKLFAFNLSVGRIQQQK